MQIYAQRNEYSCCLLTAENWPILKAIRLAQWADSSDADRLKEEQSWDEKTWRFLLNTDREKCFCLFKNNQPIGYTFLVYREEGEAETKVAYTGSFILTKHRGSHLSDLLYQARTEYLLCETNLGRGHTHIIPENIPSWKAAERNGFFCLRTEIHDGCLYKIYSLNLDNLRQLKSAPNVFLDHPNPM